MTKCLSIVLRASTKEGFLKNFIQKNARDLDIEGIVQQKIDGEVNMVICGLREQVDLFLDILHKGSSDCKIHAIEVKPFLKDKDYRGVFRVIE